MSLSPIEARKDVLQPNEQEVDLDVVWRRLRVWVFTVLGLLLVGAIATALYFHSQREKENAEIAAQTMLVEAPNEATLQAVIDKYPSSDAAIQALMLVAYYKYQNDDWKSARENYQKVYEKSASRQPDLAAAGLFGVGASYEAEKNYDKAIEAYGLLASRFPDSYKAVEAKMKEARVYELKGDIDKARKAYDNIIVTYPRSEWKSQAEQRKKLIEGRTK
jgi:TolA-binding protein